MQYKILIVDDEPGIVDMIKEYFEPEYKILAACSGEEAFQKLAAEPDLVLLDINMPGTEHFGMGLYSARMLCLKHGGTLTLKNPPGGGAEAAATFRIFSGS